MITVITCLCGGSESRVRSFLKSVGYPGWLIVPVAQGKEKSLAALNTLPPAPEKDMLCSFLANASKWVVIIGHDGTSMRWSDIAHGGDKSRIEAEFVVANFG